MKKNILFSILLLLWSCNILCAQNFQTVNSGRISYFTTTGNDFQFLKIDSVDFGYDSVFYTNRCLSDFNECYSPYHPSWSGSKIVLRRNGTNVYFNRTNDSIVIKTHAKLGEKWQVFRERNLVSVFAEVTSLDTASVLGQLDSVKVIHFHVFDSTGTKLNHRLNEMEVSISKNYGWVSTLNFNLFPDFSGPSAIYQSFVSGKLVGMDNPRLGIQNLTWFEVFDFQPGDVLHVRNISVHCWVSDTITVQRMIYTYLKRTDLDDSIVYLIDREIHETKSIDGENILSTFYDTIKSKIIANPEFDRLSGEPVVDESNRFCTVHFQYNNDGQISKDFFGMPFIKDYDGCWVMESAEGLGRTSYKKGLGEYYNSTLGDCYQEESNLVYYKKGNITWGTPFVFTGVETLSSTRNVTVYPNPASDKIVVETNDYQNPVTFELYSLGGNRVLCQTCYSAKQDVDMKSVENGLYFYKVSTSGQILKNGKITILH